MKVGSLFSGIGGLDLGLERAGMEVIWQSETDPYASKVLKKHWPTVPNLGDVTQIDWHGIERPDLVCGGFPCQPFSYAGKRKGKEDARWLWPEFARCLRVLRPRYALMENVPGLLNVGLGDVLADLATLGFNAEWDCVPAAYVGAPHLRWRIFIIGTLADPHFSGRCTESRKQQEKRPSLSNPGGSRDVADSHSRRLQIGAEFNSQSPQDPSDWSSRGEYLNGSCDDVAHSPESRLPDGGGPPLGEQIRAQSQSKRCDSPFGQLQDDPRFGADQGWWAIEPDVGRVAHGIPRRVDRLKCLGNAVVPQVAEFVGRRIMETVD